ncbi:MAG: cytochrome c [Gammaproteobacteria bacterium]|nr:cytochrome c [Rhodocyclaceae bacterium]MBU3909772.1 cytochrome c [Gammaproteobacteria bacterium]MBU3988199.1 cytochrome c [Gammaproteobacteria bacterium]MBU4005305.1 cytochrome c [Gammaproteobacteria bacterium]MBU4022483.1 cytochrome c [Gammaproteobacteria bacterium]
MKQLPALSVFIALFCAVLPAPTFAADTDPRQFVEMAPEARATLRAEMLDNQLALHQIIGALAEGKYAEAAAIAEKELGIGAMGKHRKLPSNARPGMYMTDEMHAIGRASHVAASDFAKVATAGNPATALNALQGITGTCVACHRSYRTQ